MKLEVGEGRREDVFQHGAGESSGLSKMGEAKHGLGSWGCLLTCLLKTEVTEPNTKKKCHFPRCQFLYFTDSARAELPF